MKNFLSGSKLTLIIIAIIIIAIISFWHKIADFIGGLFTMPQWLRELLGVSTSEQKALKAELDNVTLNPQQNIQNFWSFEFYKQYNYPKKSKQFYSNISQMIRDCWGFFNIDFDRLKNIFEIQFTSQCEFSSFCDYWSNDVTPYLLSSKMGFYTYCKTAYTLFNAGLSPSQIELLNNIIKNKPVK